MAALTDRAIALLLTPEGTRQVEADLVRGRAVRGRVVSGRKRTPWSRSPVTGAGRTSVEFAAETSRTSLVTRRGLDDLLAFRSALIKAFVRTAS
ncbi:hypothetical protein SAMN04487818_108295 [Actinokineospora terrae]|uniref:Uncharacterized protein n=1 Tax=Actinokineospora terrae TaxID=155974 RepID=A0A1H9VE42_9PSEU|nr:hypothetical protein SAMN04487818_108295 [Actinokineospora terrae]